jgi:hypothetical protein
MVEITYKGYKVQSLGDFILLREITSDTGTNDAGDLWEIIDHINPDARTLSFDGGIRIFVHVIRRNRWYELLSPGNGFASKVSYSVYGPFRFLSDIIENTNLEIIK